MSISKGARKVWGKNAWKPKLKGDRFCSPACGGGCTLTEHNDVLLAAKQLAKSLGSKWKPVVWENLGWHAKVVNSSLRVDINKGPAKYRYTAYLVDGKHESVLFSADDKDARDAIKSVMYQAHDYADKIRLLVSQALHDARPLVPIRGLGLAKE